jgi:transcriptional regulator with XRE-family HTH domain
MTKMKHYLQQHVQQRLECASALRHFMAASRHCKTQLALAQRAGIAQSTIGRILRGEVATQTTTLSFLVDALGITLQDFYSAIECDKSVNIGPADSTVADLASDVNAYRIARRRAEKVLEELRQQQDRALEALKQCNREEAQAIKRLDERLFGHMEPGETNECRLQAEVTS